MYQEIINTVYSKNPFETKSNFKEPIVDAFFQEHSNRKFVTAAVYLFGIRSGYEDNHYNLTPEGTLLSHSVINNAKKEILNDNGRELTYDDWKAKGLKYLKMLMSDTVKPKECSTTDWLYSLAVTHFIMFYIIPLTVKSMDHLSIANYIATNVPRWTLDDSLLLSTVPLMDCMH